MDKRRKKGIEERFKAPIGLCAGNYNFSFARRFLSAPFSGGDPGQENNKKDLAAKLEDFKKLDNNAV